MQEYFAAVAAGSKIFSVNHYYLVFVTALLTRPYGLLDSCLPMLAQQLQK